ncbi:hypothetical protein EV182_000653 [Spiromyces aspiralis]|uniref:Uncharacterized protein n=1 Tax=Spiromyces aspiralis TaxID=68401 RepID=A0ACC1HU80_9FUNG|nr:hypothetical protein EV182_000653 [Spiromyces aspiralis]
MTASPREISPSNSSETPNKRRSIDISLLVSMPPFAYKSPTSLLNEHLDDDDDDDYALTDSKLLAERRARHREATLASLQQVPRSRPQRQPRYNGDSGSELASSRGNNGPRGVSFCMPESRQPSPDQAHPSLPKMSISSSTTQSVDSIDPARLITLINRRGSHGVLEIPSPGRPRRRDSLQKLAKRYSDSAVYAKSLRKRDSISRLFQGGGSFSAWLERHKLWSRAQGSTSKPRDPADRKRKSRHASLFRRLSSSLVRRGSDSTPGANRGAPKGEGNHNARASNSSECSASQQQGKRSSQTKSWHTSNISRGEDERGGSQATERGKVSDAHFGSGVGRWSCINANLSSSDMSNGSEDGRSRRSMLNGSSPSRLQLAAAGDRVTLRPDKPSAVLDQGSAMRSQFKTFIHLGLSDEAPTSNIEGTESDILGLLSLASSQALAPSSGSNTLSPYDEVWNDGVICGSSIHMKSDSALSHEPIQEENDEIENTPVLTVAEEIAPGRGDLKQQG